MKSNKYDIAQNKVTELSADMNKLEALFQIQENFTKLIGEKPAGFTTLQEKHARMKDMILSIMAECGEVLDEKQNGIQWKPWRKFNKPKDLKAHREYVMEELIDMLHFIIEAMLVWSMTSEEVFEQYLKKMRTNIERQRGNY